MSYLVYNKIWVRLMIKKLIVLLTVVMSLMIGSVAFANENVIIPAGTELIGELVTPLNSKASKVGDPVVFKLAQNLVICNAIIVQKGVSGRAVVTHAEKATYFGQGGQIGFEPEAITTANGVSIPLTFEIRRRGSAVNDANMVVATIGVGVFAAFFHGKNQTFPAGTKFKFYVAEDVDLGVTEENLGKYFYVIKA